MSDDFPRQAYLTRIEAAKRWLATPSLDRVKRVKYVREDTISDLEAQLAQRDAVLKAADDLSGAADSLARFAFSHMTGGRQDLVDDVAHLNRTYRKARGQDA